MTSHYEGGYCSFLNYLNVALSEELVLSKVLLHVPNEFTIIEYNLRAYNLRTELKKN